MQQLKMTSITNLFCTLLHRGTEADNLITDEKICVVADNNRGACGGEFEIHFKTLNCLKTFFPGDSGGPITWEGAVVGVVSWGLRPCGSSPTVFIRVQHHIEWLQQNI